MSFGLNEQLLQGYWGSPQAGSQPQRQQQQESSGLLDGNDDTFAGINLLDNEQQFQQELAGGLSFASLFGGSSSTRANGGAALVSGGSPGGSLWDVGKAANLSAEVLARNAENVAHSMGSKGYCFRGVKRTLSRNGINLHGGSAHMADEQLDRLVEKGKMLKVDPGEIRRGDIIVHGSRYRSHSGRTGSKHGHIAVALGGNKEASDHVQSMIRSDDMAVYRLA